MRTSLDVATRKPGPPVPGVHDPGRQDPGRARQGRPAGGKLPHPRPRPARGAVRRSTVATGQARHRGPCRSLPAITTCTSPSARTIDTRQCPAASAAHPPDDNLIDNAIRHNNRRAGSASPPAPSRTARLVVENQRTDPRPGQVGELAQPFRRAARTAPAPTTQRRTRALDRRRHRHHHHGTLDLHARPHAGCTSPYTSRSPPPRAHRGSDIMRILVVEDVHGLADDIAEGCATRFRRRRRLRRTRRRRQARHQRLPGVVLDRDLPGIHGDTLCRMITESDRPA